MQDIEAGLFFTGTPIDKFHFLLFPFGYNLNIDIGTTVHFPKPAFCRKEEGATKKLLDSIGLAN